MAILLWGLAGWERRNGTCNSRTFFLQGRRCGNLVGTTLPGERGYKSGQQRWNRSGTMASIASAGVERTRQKLRALGTQTLAQREQWLNKVGALKDNGSSSERCSYYRQG